MHAARSRFKHARSDSLKHIRTRRAERDASRKRQGSHAKISCFKCAIALALRGTLREGAAECPVSVLPLQLLARRTRQSRAKNGIVREGNTARQSRGGDAALLPRLRDERDRGARASRRARRSQAGAPARAVR